jgi:hypothetical protein
MKERIARLWTEQLLFGGAARQAPGPPRRSAPLLRSFFTSTQLSGRSKPHYTSLQQGAFLYLRFQRSALARRFRSIRFKSDKTNPQHVNPTPHLGSPEPALSVSQRLKQLSREYGWTALGVYLGLSLIDFPFCFLAVRLLGTERIGHYEDVVKHAFWSIVRLAFPDAGKKSAEEIAAEEIAEAKAKAHAADACM